jgi:hypothetical protein
MSFAYKYFFRTVLYLSGLYCSTKVPKFSGSVSNGELQFGTKYAQAAPTIPIIWTCVSSLNLQLAPLPSQYSSTLALGQFYPSHLTGYKPRHYY